MAVYGRFMVDSQEEFMKLRASHLPSRFPIGTRYIVEGRGGAQGRLRVQSRYLEFPDGRHVDLPVRPFARASSGRRPVAQSTGRKII
jgi:hypothetical protein